MIIGISGYSGSGKDLVGTIIQEISLNKWHIKKWAGKLKTIASILTGIPVEKFEDQEFKKKSSDVHDKVKFPFFFLLHKRAKPYTGAHPCEGMGHADT